jgi:hypothetical protein
MTFSSNGAKRTNVDFCTEAAKLYEIVEKHITTVQTIIAREPVTGRTVTFRWEAEGAPTQQDLARVFAQVGRMRNARWEASVGRRGEHHP